MRAVQHYSGESVLHFLDALINGQEHKGGGAAREGDSVK